jgi:hypothetical protein
MHPTDSMCVIFQACLAEVVSTRRFSFSYVLFCCTSVPMHHPTLFDANLLLLCFLCGSTYWRCTIYTSFSTERQQNEL